MMFIARQKDQASANNLSTEEYIERKLSYAEMIERGEPFLLPDRTPLIYAFGPRTFWRLEMKDFLIYGQAHDPEDYEEVEDILEMRRQGNIYGRWFSRYVLDGDVGYQTHLVVSQVSYQEFVTFIDRLEKGI